MYNEKYMVMAIEEGKKALLNNEVPIGAVIVQNNKVIARAFNQKNITNIVTKHAELIAIEQACIYLNNWRLSNCDVYVTLQPCPMCMSALQQARVSCVYYGLANRDSQNELIISTIAKKSSTNPGVTLSGGHLQDEILLLMTSFFKRQRKK